MCFYFDVASKEAASERPNNVLKSTRLTRFESMIFPVSSSSIPGMGPSTRIPVLKSSNVEELLQWTTACDNPKMLEATWEAS